MTTATAIDRAFITSLTAEELGETIRHAMSEDYLTTEDLGKLLRTGSLAHLDDEVLGAVVYGGLSEEHIPAAKIGQLILDQIKATQG